jgi:hypothetical protein
MISEETMPVVTTLETRLQMLVVMMLLLMMSVVVTLVIRLLQMQVAELLVVQVELAEPVAMLTLKVPMVLKNQTRNFPRLMTVLMKMTRISHRDRQILTT